MGEFLQTLGWHIRGFFTNIGYYAVNFYDGNRELVWVLLAGVFLLGVALSRWRARGSADDSMGLLMTVLVWGIGIALAVGIFFALSNLASEDLPSAGGSSRSQRPGALSPLALGGAAGPERVAWAPGQG